MGKMSRLRRALYGFAETPSLIHVRRGSALSVAFAKIGQGVQLSEDDVRGAFNLDESAGDSDAIAQMLAAPQIIPAGGPGKAVALLSVRGVALYDMEYQPYCFSTLQLSQTIRMLSNDPEIGTIVLDFDSPGGMVTGTREAADALFAARKKKNCVALVDPLCASAAYWIASQASEIIAVPSADVGSIGVFVLHVDLSAALQMMGVKPTFIFAGKYKIEANPFEPLNEEAKAYLQGEVDATYAEFIAAVARGREKTPAYVETNFGQGRTMSADDAKSAKMIDRVAPLEVAMQRCGVSMEMMDSRRGGRRGETAASDIEAKKGGNSLHKGGESFGNSLIADGKVDRESAWLFSAEDGNKLLGPNGDDWANYGKHHLGQDASQPEDSKAHWKYPFAKADMLYRSALTAIRQRAGQQNDTDIFNAAGRMMEKCDKDKGASAGPTQNQGAESAAMAALMAGSSLILLRSHVDADGGKTVSVDEPWPAKTMIVAALLDGQMFIARDADEIRVIVANGRALYRKIGEDCDGAWICELLESTYQPYPADPPLSVSVEDAASAVEIGKKAAEARSRRLALLKA